MLGSRMLLASEITYRRLLFEQKIRQGKVHECWEWTGAKSTRGAGTFGLGDWGVRSANVAAWILYRDPAYNPDLPNVFHHLCGNKSCVNPRHLAVIGPDGLVNPQEVVRFLADRNPAARAHLLIAAENLSAETDARHRRCSGRRFDAWS